VFNPNLAIITNCDRTTSRLRGLSPKIISRDSRRSKNVPTQHINIQYHIKFKIKLLQFECHVFRVQETEAQKIASKDNTMFLR
jgi:hypothetical protein